MNIGELQEIKKRYGYTTELLSKESGVPLGTLNKILSEETKRPRKDAVQKLEAWMSRMTVRKESTSLRVAQKPQGTYTYDDISIADDDYRYECCDGKLFVMEGPNMDHIDITESVYEDIKSYIRKNKGSCRAYHGQANVFPDESDRTFFVPDIVVLCDERKLRLKGIWGAPDFVLEVMSASTRNRDIGLKADRYISAGIREYWIIDPKNKKLIIYDNTKSEVDISIHLLKGKQGLRIYNEACKINLDEINSIIENWSKKD